jgi:hypothetical protein
LLFFGKKSVYWSVNFLKQGGSLKKTNHIFACRLSHIIVIVLAIAMHNIAFAQLPFNLNCSNEGEEIQANFFNNGGFYIKRSSGYGGGSDRYVGKYFFDESPQSGGSYSMTLELSRGTFEDGSATGEATFLWAMNDQIVIILSGGVDLDCEQP